MFTFGAGMYGQLGHNSSNAEALPKKVFELMGSEVSQIACGRLVSMHTCVRTHAPTPHTHTHTHTHTYIHVQNWCIALAYILCIAVAPMIARL